MNTKVRLHRLFAEDGRCVNVAVDHGFFGEYPFLEGIESMPQVVTRLAAAQPDAIQLSLGMAPLLQNLPGKHKPALVMRVDTANIYGPAVPAQAFNYVVAGAVEQALALDAACLCANLFQVPGHPEVHAQCVANISQLKPECERYGLPLMVEPLVFQPNPTGGYASDGDLRKIMANVRQAVELGADVIKADPCSDLEAYGRVIEVASGCPVLVRGGSKAPEAELLRRTEAVLAQGAVGIVYGRNIIQHPSPSKIVRALMAVVHEGASAETALELLA